MHYSSLADLPRRHYGAILFDPPWAFKTYKRDDAIPQRAKADHYKTMTIREIAALPIDEIAARDCTLFLWVIDTHLPQALDLMRVWGFRYTTIGLQWTKVKSHVQSGLPLAQCGATGMGYWTRKGAEIALLGIRGRPKRLSRGVRQVIIEPVRDHSRKPDSQYLRVEQLVAGPYLELCSRTDRAGWDSWGDESGKFGEAV